MENNKTRLIGQIQEDLCKQGEINRDCKEFYLLALELAERQNNTPIIEKFKNLLNDNKA
jgi:hypothetical protein